MKKLNITTILFCLILFITACGGSEDEVAIGTQTWTSKNLDVETYRNGDPIPQVQDNKTWLLIETGAWCYYENKTANGTKYGKLYNWYAVIDERGLAPKGYHIPTDAEWTTLTTNLGGASVAGGKMKETGTSHWKIPNRDATNSSGFTGFPGGFRYPGGRFSKEIGEFAYWWSSSEIRGYDLDRASRWTLNFFSGYLGSLKKEYKQCGYYVRCIKD